MQTNLTLKVEAIDRVSLIKALKAITKELEDEFVKSKCTGYHGHAADKNKTFSVHFSANDK